MISWSRCKPEVTVPDVQVTSNVPVNQHDDFHMIWVTVLVQVRVALRLFKLYANRLGRARAGLPVTSYGPAYTILFISADSDPSSRKAGPPGEHSVTAAATERSARTLPVIQVERQRRPGPARLGSIVTRHRPPGRPSPLAVAHCDRSRKH